MFSNGTFDLNLSIETEREVDVQDLETSTVHNQTVLFLSERIKKVY